MGQQQLLLLALTAIIVGLSIVMGLNMFGESAAQSNLDAVTTDVLTIAARAQGWYRKPAQMGGGGRAFTNIGATPSVRLNFPDTTQNGYYDLTPAAQTLTIAGTGVEDIDGDGTPLTVTVVVVPDSVRPAVITQ